MVLIIKKIINNVLAEAVYKSQTYARRRRIAIAAVDPVDNSEPGRANVVREDLRRVTHKSTDRSQAYYRLEYSTPIQRPPRQAATI